jgi:hypothetical protein
MKVDQVAIYAVDERVVEEVKADFNLTNAVWTRDVVTAYSKVIIGNELKGGENVAELLFNYDLGGIEFEIIRYLSGYHWHAAHLANRKFISHIGVHLDDGEPFPLLAGRIVQETWTQTHTSDYLTNPTSPGYLRTYHYRIFELSPGSYIKFIRRIHPTKVENDAHSR